MSPPAEQGPGPSAQQGPGPAAEYAVLDANVVLALALPLPYSTAASDTVGGLKTRGVELLAPALLDYEVGSALRRAVSSGVMAEAAALSALEWLHDLGLRPISPAFSLHRRALAWAARLGQSKAYDSQYLALAEEMHCDLYTSDRRLWEAARACGINWVRSVS